MFVRNYVIPVLALAGVVMAVYTVRSENKQVTPAKPVAEPASSPYDIPVAGAGIVEASTQNLAIGTHVPGIVSKVLVKVGDRVKAGAPLFVIDDRAQRAELASRHAALVIAQATLDRLKELPRGEDVPPAEARVAEMEAQVADMQAQLSRWEGVKDERAVNKDELSKRRFAVDGAKARLAQAKTALDLLRAGTWTPDLEVAGAQVESAQAQLAAAQTELERLTVKAPVDGQILQLNVRTGEFAQTGALATPLILMGNTDVLHVRVDVDENDAWRVTPEAHATAFVRGNRTMKTELRFVRIEPYVVPKRSLTGDSAERVDTRVLQVLYAFDAGTLPVYVGQQMDVFIDSAAVKKDGGT
jgi:HlyD family secretion protein